LELTTTRRKSRRMSAGRIISLEKDCKYWWTCEPNKAIQTKYNRLLQEKKLYRGKIRAGAKERFENKLLIDADNWE